MQWDCPTYAALIMFGKNPRYFMPGAYIQFVRFKGATNGGEILNERRFEGLFVQDLATVGELHPRWYRNKTPCSYQHPERKGCAQLSLQGTA